MSEYSAQPNYRECGLSPGSGSGNISVMPKRGPYRKTAKSPPPRWRRNFVKEWRLYRKMTVEKLAEEAGLSQGTVSAIENLDQGYSDESLEKLAKALKTSRGALLDVNPHQASAADFWTLWDRASEAQRAQLTDIARTIAKPSKTARN